jgi:hypothetical protein
MNNDLITYVKDQRTTNSLREIFINFGKNNNKYVLPQSDYETAAVINKAMNVYFSDGIELKYPKLDKTKDPISDKKQSSGPDLEKVCNCIIDALSYHTINDHSSTAAKLNKARMILSNKEV